MDKITKYSRISSIDVLRGLVMVIMALDHVRERFFMHEQILDPMSIPDTSSPLFFTRLLAHLCAPIFVFLTGLSAWLYINGKGRSLNEGNLFLLKRGIFLILLEITLVNFSWFGNYNTLYLQVIWAIGISMISLAALIRLPHIWVGIIGVVIVCGHNALSPIAFEPGELGYELWTILHDRGYLYAGEILSIKASYPVLAWIGVIALGYIAGPLFGKNVLPKTRQKALNRLGFFSIVLFIILRIFNIYGESAHWCNYDTQLETIMSFVNLTKYPPSLGFILLTLGIGVLLLSFFERCKTRKYITVLKNFGSAPMFFYLLHLYTLLLAYTICVSIWGTNKGMYFGVDEVWHIWVLTSVLLGVLYYPTKAFSKYKRDSSFSLMKYL